MEIIYLWSSGSNSAVDPIMQSFISAGCHVMVFLFGLELVEGGTFNTFLILVQSLSCLFLGILFFPLVKFSHPFLCFFLFSSRSPPSSPFCTFLCTFTGTVGTSPGTQKTDAIFAEHIPDASLTSDAHTSAMIYRHTGLVQALLDRVGLVEAGSQGVQRGVAVPVDPLPQHVHHAQMCIHLFGGRFALRYRDNHRSAGNYSVDLSIAVGGG